MPNRHYTIVDGRRDHGFRIPRQMLKARVGSPDVGTGCHEDNTAQWAGNENMRRLSASYAQDDHFGQAFRPIVGQRLEVMRRALMALVLDRQQPAIVRASARYCLAGSTTEAELEQTATLLEDDRPLVRAEAVGLLIKAPCARHAEWLGPSPEDPIRSVGIEAAK